ncbi:MAG: Mur ligase family protein [Candidatus Poseidoniia archaeon]|jgi:dihydrofolate synthase/folylpolyglutamate synthase|nr:hypothetical protein [Euryarchaeota archaeon]MDP6489193.1 Mur ligase family protein [Candidatus Poseidoniia archaeon]MDP6534346.1 Mur ligase family protein [Candidatus Poseidoniia archaeon]MDP6834670.1 Mur ligase family protein [Candidatus Poseidoniia archaeon]HIH79397.1 hypothetical protein [Candidatus Poseidoniia archaeon]|tara:strand:+ start:1213 stop:2319 length:1107 start_codon:yes stop_codon:yes gene_type:complete
MDGREISDYPSALKWLARLDETRVKPGLERITQLMAVLGDPQQQMRAIVIGGTNGKGSCCWLLEDALCRAGIRVGCATSPHLHSVRERLRLDGKLIGQDDFATLAGEVQQACREMTEHPSYFEVLTAMTLLWFARCRVEVAVLEVGLGGELDAMNIVDAEVAVLTTLALEHTDWLGSDLGTIARTKAGIVRPQTRVVTGWEVEFQRYIPQHTKLICGGSALEWATLALEQLGVVASVYETQPPGRREQAGNILLDCAHNPHALAWLLDCIPEPDVVLFGCLRDKQLPEMLALLPPSAELLACTPNSPRAHSAAEVMTIAEKLERNGRTCDSIATALERAGERPALVTGSNYLVAEARKCLGLPGSEEP